MSDPAESHFRLLFAGKVLEGQHQAVVKKRLGALLKVEGERLEKLFSGSPVVLKKEADKKTAARYKAAFEKAGAKLLIKVLPGSDTPDAAPPAAAHTNAPVAETATPDSASPDSATPDRVAPDTTQGLTALPVGADVLAPEERAPEQATSVSTDHLSMGEVGETLGNASPPPPPAPDVDHLSLGEVGETLADSSSMVTPAAPDVDYLSVGDVGEDLVAALESIEPAIDLDDLNFDLADVGADLGEADDAPPPAAPDTTHISVQNSD